MEEELRALLLATSAITSLTGNRIDWGATAQGETGTRLVLWVIDGAEGVTMSGPDRLFQGRVQADCYADSVSGTMALSRALLDCLSGYRGGSFQGVFHESTRLTREGGSNEANRPFRASLDFLVNWSNDNG